MCGMFQRKSNQAEGHLLDVEIVPGNVRVARKRKVREEALEYWLVATLQDMLGSACA